MTPEQKAKKCILEMRPFLGMERYSEGDIDKIALAALDALGRDAETIKNANEELHKHRLVINTISEAMAETVGRSLPSGCSYEHSYDIETVRKLVVETWEEVEKLRKREAALFDALMLAQRVKK